MIVGRSNIVGKPMANLLMQQGPGGDATVTVCHSRTRDLPAVTRTRRHPDRGDREAPSSSPPTWCKPGAVVIDVGINRVDDASPAEGLPPRRRRGLRPGAPRWRRCDHAGAGRRRADDDRDAAVRTRCRRGRRELECRRCTSRSSAIVTPRWPSPLPAHAIESPARRTKSGPSASSHCHVKRLVEGRFMPLWVRGEVVGVQGVVERALVFRAARPADPGAMLHVADRYNQRAGTPPKDGTEVFVLAPARDLRGQGRVPAQRHPHAARPRRSARRSGSSSG